MKKILCVLLSSLLVVTLFASCGNVESKETDKLSVVTTIFPEYDWVMQILGDEAENFDVTMLLDNGVDLHSYQPTADDIIKISDCDLFIYVGGESDEWVDGLIEGTGKTDIKAINLLDTLGALVKEEETVDGMESHEDHDEDETEYDEHVWLSLKNAENLVKKISAEIQAIDPADKDAYEANTKAYIEKLELLDKEYEAAVASAKHKALLFGDRFPFRYLADDYNLTYYAAFSGCSAESEADFETVSFLAQKVDELGLPCVLTLEGTTHKIAETVVQATNEKNQTVLTMDSMQSTSSQDVKNGATYLSIMEKNLTVLKTALG